MAISDGLVLYWKLDDEINATQKKILDASPNQVHGTVEGEPQSVFDDRFGTCLKFSGDDKDCVKLSNFSQWPTDAITFACWVKVDLNEVKAKNDYRVLISYATSYSYHIIPNVTTRDFRLLNVDSSLAPTIQNKDGTTTSVSFKDGNWHHLATTWQQSNGNFIVYKDGLQAGEETLLRDEPFKNGGTMELGQDVDQTFHGGGAFQGEVAHVRIYNRVLGQREIQQIMELDQTSAFRESHPLDFSLYDDNDLSAIYISDDPASQLLHFDVTNRSGQTIQLEGSSESVSADHHHFELRFRPKTLLSPSSITLAGSGWTNVHQKNSNNTHSLYFLNRAGQTLQANEKIQFTLNKIIADGSNGARGSQVELKFGHSLGLTYPGQTDRIRGHRIQHLEIVNHVGKKYIPLHAGFVGANRVLNDGATNNSLVRPVPLKMR